MTTSPRSHIAQTLVTLAFALLALPLAAHAEIPAAKDQIAGAVSPAPEGLQEGATVLGYAADTKGLVPLRQGDGDLICLADDPSDERFHAACYFKALEPFMARGRALRAEGKKRDEVLATRAAEIKSGKIEMPPHSALYSLTGPVDSFDPTTGQVTGANRTTVVYLPYATAETTGLSPKPAVGAPWIMSPGEPWAHIMLVHPAEKAEGE
ncbi:MAG: hypothetical protein AAF657_16940 [Acidobacteriota bacterium]